MNEDFQVFLRPAQPTDPYQRGDRFHAPQHRQSEMGAYLFHFIFWSSYVIGGWLGVKAGKNHLARGIPLTEAIAKGINAGRRWTFWILAVWLMFGMGLFSLMMIDADGKVYDYNGGIHMWAVTMAIAPFILWPIIFVIYNRNIDQSLFKRRWLYRVVSPLAHRLDRFSSITLYLMIPVVPYAIAIILDITGVV